MTIGQRGFRRFFPLIGLILLATGLAVLFAQVHPLAAQVWDRVGANADELGGFVPAAILTVNQAAQAWAFDRANLLSAFADMLLSCWSSVEWSCSAMHSTEWPQCAKPPCVLRPKEKINGLSRARPKSARRSCRGHPPRQRPFRKPALELAVGRSHRFGRPVLSARQPQHL